MQVSPTSEAKTDTDISQMTGLESQQCIQSSASGALREVWHWRKGWWNWFIHISKNNSVSKMWLIQCKFCKSNMTCSFFDIWHFVSGESGHWAGAVVKLPREEQQLHHHHQWCLTGHRAPHPPGVQRPAPPALCPHMCTTHQSWMNLLPSSRNQEKTLKAQRKKLKALLPLKSR